MRSLISLPIVASFFLLVATASLSEFVFADTKDKILTRKPASYPKEELKKQAIQYAEAISKIWFKVATEKDVEVEKDHTTAVEIPSNFHIFKISVKMSGSKTPIEYLIRLSDIGDIENIQQLGWAFQ